MDVSFKGFEESKKRFTGIPDQFFSEVLPHVGDLDELKVVLYLLWCAYTSGDFGMPFSLDDFSQDPIFMQGFSDEKKLAGDLIRQALDRAAEDHILIKIPSQDGDEAVYFINSPRGRQAARLQLESETIPTQQKIKATLDIIQPNLFRLYEENIGPLTPLLADELRDAQETYPENWLREAIEIAVHNNVRRWSYINKILTRWQEEGRDGTDQRYTQEDYRRYLKGEYGDFGQH